MDELNRLDASFSVDSDEDIWVLQGAPAVLVEKVLGRKGLVALHRLLQGTLRALGTWRLTGFCYSIRVRRQKVERRPDNVHLLLRPVTNMAQC
jgi:hypothetical protein